MCLKKSQSYVIRQDNFRNTVTPESQLFPEIIMCRYQVHLGLIRKIDIDYISYYTYQFCKYISIINVNIMILLYLDKWSENTRFKITKEQF